MSSTRLLPDGELIEVPPTHCPRGHRIRPGEVLVGWAPCDCRGFAEKGASGHRTYLCQADVDGHPCGIEVYRPPCRNTRSE